MRRKRPPDRSRTPGNSTRPIALDEHIGPANQTLERVRAGIAWRRSRLGGALAAARVDHQRRECTADAGAVIRQHLRAMYAARVRVQTGPAMIRVRSSTRTPSSGRGCERASELRWRIADPVDPHRDRRDHGLALRAMPAHSAWERKRGHAQPGVLPPPNPRTQAPDQPRQGSRHRVSVVRGSRAGRSTPSRWCGKFVCKPDIAVRRRIQPGDTGPTGWRAPRHPRGAGVPTVNSATASRMVHR